MGSEIELISDGDGLAVIGEAALVEQFLHSEGLQSRDLGLDRLRRGLGAASGLAQTGSELAANSGRWMKLTDESARIAQKFPLVTNTATGNAHATLRAANGQFVKNLQFVQGPGAFLMSPAFLAGAAGIMAQLAMQQAMDEITDYLATIDEKVDDVLRAQKDAVVADMIGVGFAVEEAMAIREQVGHVSDVTWSKVQATPTTIARTQAYALRQLDALAEKLERKSNVTDLAETTEEARAKVHEWLAVLARCFQLQDGIAVLELDRVLDASPDELDQHRLGLRAARQNRLELIAQSTAQLLARMDAAAGTANTKVLLHPLASRSVVDATNQVAATVVDFRGRLGIVGDRDALAARRWVDAAVDARDDVLEAGAEGVGVALRVGNETVERARTMTNKFSDKIADGARRLRKNEEEN
jgi:hypothetical protein